MSSVFPGALDAFSTTHTDGVKEVIRAATTNELADAVNKIEPKVGTGSSTPVANSVFASTGTGVSAWATIPSVLGIRSPTTNDSLYFDNQGAYPSNFLTDARINIKRSSSAVRTNFVYGQSIHIQGRQASTLNERIVGLSVYMEDSLVTDKAVTNAVNNGSGLIRLTVTGHGYSTGDSVLVWNVGGVTNANGKWLITVIDANTADLQGSTFAGTYTSGGTMSNRPPMDALQLIINPDVSRGTDAASLNFDDFNGLRIHNNGPGKAADAIWVDENVSGSGFYTILGADADADDAIWLDGAYNNAIRITNNHPITVGVAPAVGGLIRIPNNQSLSARNAANSADVVLIWANTANEVQLGAGNVVRIPTLTKFTTGAHVELGTTGTGTQWGTGATQKQAWWGATPVVQPAAVADATGGSTVDAEARTAINTLLARLRTTGQIAT